MTSYCVVAAAKSHNYPVPLHIAEYDASPAGNPRRRRTSVKALCGVFTAWTADGTDLTKVTCYRCERRHRKLEEKTMSTTEPGPAEQAMAATDDPAARALDAAVAVARYAPATRGTYVSKAQIYWPLIEELRAALDALGIEWRSS